MPYGVQKFKLPRASWVGHRRSINSQSACIQIAESSVIDVLPHDAHAPLEAEKDTGIEAEHKRIDEAPWNQSTFWQPSTIKTCGRPNTKIHDNPQGLAQVIFDNCVVKVRVGFDLDNLISLGRLGEVDLMNVTAFGWVTTNRSLLPCCIFERWISTMQAASE
jgi:hypothetical protein